MVTTLRILLHDLCKPVVILNVFDNLPWHRCYCTRHTGLYHLFSPSFPFLLPPMSAAGKASYWEFGICESQVHARNGDWALVFECFPSNSITHQYRKVSLHWIPWHNSIKCFSSKQKTLCNPDALLTASTLRQKAKPCILPQHIKNTFNNQLRFRSALIKA